MSQKQLAVLLKTIIVGLTVCGVLVCVFLIPYFADSVLKNSHLSAWYWYWIAVVYIAIAPWFIVLFLVWKIAVSIEQDQSFTKRNARLLKHISYISLSDSAFFLVIHIIFALLNMSHPSIFFTGLLVSFVGIAFTVVTAALSHLVSKASDIREENEYTI